MAFFPIFINLHEQPVLIVGAGTVAYRKTCSLLDFAAKVVVVAPTFHPAFKELGSRIECLSREFLVDDIKSKKLVIAATSNRNLNCLIADECHKERIPVNVVDEADLCDFYFPALVKRGDLVVGITSGGQAPLLSRELRKVVDNMIPDEFEKELQHIGDLRRSIISSGKRPSDNEEFNAKIKSLMSMVNRHD